jgi:hypothetical protein
LAESQTRSLTSIQEVKTVVLTLLAIIASLIPALFVG